MGIDAARAARLAALLRAELVSLRSVISEAEAAATIETPAGLVLRGAGDVAHDLYTGTERIMERVADEFDGGAPGGAAWHRELLRSMALDLPGNRPPLLERAAATWALVHADVSGFLAFLDALASPAPGASNPVE